jgi:hypothetical protein
VACLTKGSPDRDVATVNYAGWDDSRMVNNAHIA